MALVGQGRAALALVAHKGADPNAHFHEPGHFKRNQRLAHRGARNPEAHRQVALRRQLPPRLDLARQDLIPDLVGNLDVKFAVGYGLKFHSLPLEPASALRKWVPSRLT